MILFALKQKKKRAHSFDNMRHNSCKNNNTKIIPIALISSKDTNSCNCNNPEVIDKIRLIKPDNRNRSNSDSKFITLPKEYRNSVCNLSPTHKLRERNNVNLV